MVKISGKNLRLAGSVFVLVMAGIFCVQSLNAAGTVNLTPLDRFGSLLTIDEAIQRALKGQVEVKQALARLSKEESLYRESIAEFLPVLKGDTLQALATGDESRVSYFDAGIEQPLFQGGKTLAQKKKHKAIVQSEELKLEQVKLDTELGIRVLYARVLQEKELISRAQDEVSELSREYERMKQLVEKEILPRYEFFRVETLLQSAKHALVKHKETYDYLLSVLKESTGIEEGESLDLEPLSDFPELEREISEYLDLARENDPVYRLKDLSIRAKQYEKRELQAERFPEISAVAKWNRLHDVFADADRFMIGIVGKWNIWDFGRLGNRIKSKSHEIEETEWEGAIAIRNHEQEIRRIFHEARAAREKIRLAETLVQERAEIYKNEKTKLVAGEKGAGELIDSFIALEEAKIEKVQSITDYRILLANLERKTGGRLGEVAT